MPNKPDVDSKPANTSTSLGALQEYAPHPYQSLNSDGEIRAVNDAWLDELGYEREAVKDSFFGEFLAKDSVDKFKSRFPEFKSTGSVSNIEFEMQCADGEIIVVSFDGRIEYDDNGSVIRAHCQFRDITERNQRREKYRSLFEDTRDALMIFDRDGYLDCNSRTLELFGVDSVDDFLDTSPWGLSPPKQPDGRDSQAAAMEHIETAFEEGEDFFEWTHQRADGTKFPAEVKLSQISIGNETEIFALIRNITDRKEREQELKESRKRFQTLFEKAPEAIIVHDTEGNIQEVNQREIENLGYSEEELTSMNAYETDTTHSREEVLSLWAEIDFRQTKKVEAKLQRKDGSVFPAEISLNKIQTNEGVRILSFARDITERKERDREITRLKERNELAVDGANLGVWDWDIQTNQMRYNKQWAEMLGYSLEELEPNFNAWEKRVHPDDLPEIETAIDAHLTGGTAYFDEEYRIHTKSGDWKWIQTIGKTFERNEKGEPVRAVGIHQDITERKRAEQNLRNERERYERLFELLPSPVAHTRLENDEHIIKNVNSAFEDTFGHKEKAIRGDSLNEVLASNVEGNNDLRTISQRTIEEGAIEAEVRRDTVDGPRTFRLDAKLHDYENGLTEAYVVYTDITERQQREKAFLESIRDIITLVDEEGVIRYESPAVEDIHGYDPEERVGHSGLEYIHPKDRDRVEMKFVDLFAGESKLAEVEYRAKNTDGSWKWIESRAKVSPVKTELGGLVISSRDISERKRREQELETVFHHMDDAVFVLSEDGSFIFVNQTTTERYGYDKSEFAEMTPSDIDAVQEEKQVEEVLDTINREGTYRFETKHLTETGDQIPVEINASSIMFRGKPATLSIARDITDRKKRVKRLEKRERILRSLHTTTEELLGAETKVDVFEEIVEGLTKALKYQFIGVRRFDSDESALVPAAMSPALAEDSGGPTQVGPGEHPVWQVFTEAETRTIRDIPPNALPDSLDASTTAVLAVPIGNEGVIILADQSDELFEDIEIDMVELLSKNAEAMLERLEREAEIQELDHQITDMETQMGKMKSWMNAIETIQQQLSENDTKEAMEQVVCEELVGVEGIEFAWIGKPQTSDAAMKAVEWAGADYGYLDSVDLEEGTEELPSLQAATQRTKITISNVADHVSAGEWAKVALSANFRSLVSIPIVNDDVLYGVLTAYSTKKSAFGQLAQSLMADMGTLLANAYRMVNIQSGTSDAKVEELEFSIRDDSYPLLALAQASEATVSFDAVLETTESTVQVLLSVVDGEGERVLEQAETMLKITDSDWFGKPEDGQLVLTLEKPFIAEAIQDHGGRVVESVADPDNATLRIHYSTNVMVRHIIEWVSAQYEEIDLLARRTRQQPERNELANVEAFLTERQYETLKAAYNGGYYETPKGITGKQLAESFDLSRPAVYNHLQAAQGRLLKRVFDPVPNSGG